MEQKPIQTIDKTITHQIILLRVDFNVPIKNKKVQDNFKIKESLLTIKLLAKKNTLILLTHLGDPKGKKNNTLSTRPLAHELSKLIGQPVKFIPSHNPAVIKDAIKTNKYQIFMLENLRFDKREEENNTSFAEELASVATMYVNDAFAVCHRPHSSIVGLPLLLPHRAGFLLHKEIENLNQALHPQKPSVWIMGGAKLDKVELLQQALKKADTILIGGALGCVFLASRNYKMGKSKVDDASIKIAREILHHRNHNKITLPIDFRTAKTITPKSISQIKAAVNLQDDDIALDLGPKTIQLFKNKLQNAKTIVWNGPLGYFELPPYQHATQEIASYIGSLQVTAIVGGGETGQALRLLHKEKKITHISTGGGASLQYLSGKELPGIKALQTP